MFRIRDPLKALDEALCNTGAKRAAKNSADQSQLSWQAVWNILRLCEHVTDVDDEMPELQVRVDRMP